MTEVQCMTPKFTRGQWVESRMNGLCGDELVERGMVVACVMCDRLVQPAPDPWRYRLEDAEGRDMGLFRERFLHVVSGPIRTPALA